MCVCPGAPPPVIEIPSSRRRAGLLSVHAFHILVMEVLPSRQQGVVRVSGGSTPGYRDTVFQTGGASVFSVLAFHIPGY